MFTRIKNYLNERRKRRFIIKSYFAYLKNPCTIDTTSPMYYAVKDYEELIKYITKKQEE
jgi:hypothetical protein